MSEVIKHLAVGELTKVLAAAKKAQDDSLIFVDFYADWCHFCQISAPAIEELAQAYPEIKFLKVDVDEDGEAAVEFGAQSIPLVIIFKNGVEAEQILGFPGKQAYEQMIKTALKKKA